MENKCYMVVTKMGRAVFLDYETAVSYATKYRGIVIQMIESENQNANHQS